jgi:ribonucleotide reductase, class II
MRDTQRQALSELTYKQSYARHNAALARRERWEESVERVMQMHRDYLGPERAKLLEAELNEIEAAYKAQKILGSQRSLQFGGDAVLSKHARSYNCTSCYVDSPKRFPQALYLLLCGAGVGYSVQHHHVAQLPYVRTTEELVSAPTYSYTIPDTIEGWCDALDALIQGYMSEGAYLPSFDLSEIRPAGAPIKSCGGKAPGPYPLRTMLQQAEALLRSRAGQKLRPCDASDLMCITADCVRAGGVRRSALICLFSPDDKDMISYKSADQWWVQHPYRARANISALVLRDDEEAETRFKEIFAHTRSYGEPGVIWADSTETAYNPCVAPDTLVLTDQGYKRIKGLSPTTLMLDPRFGKGPKGSTSVRGGFMTAPERQLYRLSTREGYEVECTEEHEIMTQRGWVKACELVDGDLIHIANTREHSSFGNSFSERQGLVLGWLLGDGCVLSPTQGRLYFYGDKRTLAPIFAELTERPINEQPEHNRMYIDFPLSMLSDIKEGWSTETKRDLPDAFYAGSFEFMSGFLRALFSADGGVQGTNAKGVSVRLTQTHIPLLQLVQRVLLQMGIFSKLYTERRSAGTQMLPNGWGGLAEYPVKAVHEIVVSRDSLCVFAQDIGFLCKKQEVLWERINERVRRPYADRFVAKFESFEPTRLSPVYDLTQPDTSSFVANGVVVHNCVEIGMVPTLIRAPSGEVVESYTPDLLDPAQRDKHIEMGFSFETAFQFCNLTEVNASTWESKVDAAEAVRRATILGLIQASYTGTEDDYLAGTVTKQILEREYLCGVSLTGLGTAKSFARDPGFLRQLGTWARGVADEYYEKVGLKCAPARVTCVKPSGTASVLLGCSSGIHADHARRFIRRVQMPKDSPIVQEFMALNPRAVEDSVWSTHGTDVCISFAVLSPLSALLKTEQTATEFLDFVHSVQKGWVQEGTLRPDSVVGLTHNVSNTCVVQQDEWDSVQRALLDGRDVFAGVSCLSATGDYDYPQAPFQRVYLPAEIEDDDPLKEKKLQAWEHWSALRELYVPVDYDSVLEETDNTELIGEGACVGGACELKINAH